MSGRTKYVRQKKRFHLCKNRLYFEAVCYVVFSSFNFLGVVGTVGWYLHENG